MSLFPWLFTAVGGVVLTWASHHPYWHDPAIWLLGVLGHHFGMQTVKNGNGNNSPGV